MATTYTWKKDTLKKKTYGIYQDDKEKASLKRKNLFSAEGEGAAGKNQFLFRPDGRFDRVFDIFNGSDEKKIGSMEFRWVDFQKSSFKLENGKTYFWRSHEVLKGAWAWYEEDKPNPLMTFRVDNPFHRSGEIEFSDAKLSAADRDLLLTLGLQLMLYVNIWFVITILVIIAVVS